MSNPFRSPPAYYLYVMHDSMYFKIGVSANPMKRCRECQTGNPNFINLVSQVNCLTSINAYWLERRLQVYFLRNHVRGEWYRDLTAEAFTAGVKSALVVLDEKRFGAFKQAAAKIDVRGWPHDRKTLAEMHAQSHFLRKA